MIFQLEVIAGLVGSAVDGDLTGAILAGHSGPAKASAAVLEENLTLL